MKNDQVLNKDISIRLGRFNGCKQQMMSIPKKQRQEYLNKIVKIQQLPGPPPFKYIKQYPIKDKFKYKEYNLHYQCYQNTSHPTAILFFFHGMGSYSGLSGYYANKICEYIQEINIYAFDQKNFGQSQGSYRGLTQDFQDSVSQAQIFIEFILNKLPNKPKIFLGGFSYGGSMSLKLSIKYPQRYVGLILLAPGIKVNRAQFNSLLILMGKIIHFLFPPYRGKIQKQFKLGTKYNNKQFLLNNKLNYNDGLIIHTYAASFYATEEINKSYNLVYTPYILFMGTNDKYVDVFAPLDLEQLSPSKDKTTIYCKNMWHAVLAEQEIQDIAYQTINWLRNRI